MVQELKQIFKNNTFHARIILTVLYLEKVSFLKLPFAILRKFVNQALYHCEIHPDSFIDKNCIASCRLPHPFLIIIHRSAKIGAGSVIFQGVTVGVVERKNSQAARLGDNIYIGCNSSILGEVMITDDVTIGAHSLILKDITQSGTYLGLIK